MGEELILSIDAGTQSVRASLVDLRGEIRRFHKTPIQPYYSARPGWAEQDPEYYWRMLCDTCGRLLAEAGGEKEALKAVAITTQRATMINVDPEGRPLRPAIVWLDARQADTSKIIPAPLRPLLRVLGLGDFIEFLAANCEATWIRQNQPGVWEKTHKFLLLSGFLIFRMTGEFRESVGNVFGYLPIDLKKGAWAGRASPLWRLFPVERGKLPDLVPVATLLGRVTNRASRQTGIPAGLPVVAAANDKACEILGCGCLTPETACLSFGTMASADVPNRRYVEVRPRFPPFPAALPGQYYTEVTTMRGFWMVSWFRDQFGHPEKRRAEEEGKSPEALLDELIAGIPPGSEGLVLHPCWTPGPMDDPAMKGSIIGFTSIHTRAHLYRAILEGVIYSLKQGIGLLEKKNRTRIRQLRVSGGGSQSRTAVQIAADVFGLPAQRPHVFETSSIGAAIDAAVGLGYHSDFKAAVREMTRVRDTFDPDPVAGRIYGEIFEKVYSRIPETLLPLFRNLHGLYQGQGSGGA